jgi:hypothetical protein
MRIILWLTIALDIGVFSMPSADGTLPSRMELNETEFENQTEVMADQVHWAVEDCILVGLASQIVLKPDPDDANTTVTMELPVGATASGTCIFVADPMKDDPTPKQRITLNWSENGEEGATLWRNITIEFSRNGDLQNYGVSKIEAVYEVKKFHVVKNTTDPATKETIPTNVTVTEFVSMTTFKMQPWAFLVPVNRSYLCTDDGRQMMHAELHRSDEHPGDGGVKLAEAVLSAANVQLDAFRVGAPEGEFQVSMDCTHGPNDDVHILGEVDLPPLTDDIQPLLITGQAEDLPTLPEAIQLFQLESMNNLRQTIQSQEGVIRGQVTRIAELEGMLEDKDLLIVSMTAEGRREKALCETEKAQLTEDFAAEKEKEKKQCEAEISECQADKTRVKEEFAAKK